MSPFWKSVLVTSAGIVALVALRGVGPSAYRYHPTEDTELKKLVRTLHKRGLNREARDREVAGYYEGLLDETTKYTRVTVGAGLFDWQRWFGQAATKEATVQGVHRRHRTDFLYYDLPANIDAPEYDDPRLRLVTNSHGMADKEYTVAKPPRIRRIALIGASIARGMGTPPGRNFEALLEDRLNEQHTSVYPKGFEILNFAVQGYNVTQLVDVARERVPPFAPDVYLLEVSELTVFRKWTQHLAALVRSRQDLKYDFLRRIVQQAGVTPDQPAALINVRLARFRLPTVRWALETIEQSARDHGAQLVLILMPSADDPEVLLDQFAGFRPVLRQLNIPYVDILDTFAYLPSLEPVRVNFADRHPNEEGHRMLFESLYTRLVADETVRHIILGQPHDPDESRVPSGQPK